MNSKTYNVLSKTNFSSSSTTNALSKLRRLKIEENLLLQNLQKLDTKMYNEGQGLVPLESENDKDSEYKNLVKKLQDTFIKLKNLYDDVKTISSSHELLAEIDIDEIKTKVLDLEKSLKSSKNYLDKELNSLKAAEQDIIHELNEINLKESYAEKKKTKIPSANLSQIVPSPVRLLMTSPFKSSEVQDFQDFMKNSPNRYGGWIEYHHNIFVKYWLKYFGDNETASNESYAEDLAFENFVDEVLLKLQGVDKSSLISHIEWYKKYLYLKERQQKAINKWKSRRPTCMRKVSEQIRKSKHELGGVSIDIERTKPKQKALDDDDITRLMKPTKQWLSRSFDQNQIDSQINHIENIGRLRTPNWRLGL